ncbi:zinc ribbon domain-containing protein [Paenarthrobacter sp. NCHU4564]|uniref:zinc ribbon domain-containing protein n=1 Tax=Paenarthrobacter sp. NCHU4564 TaxID=3451353 RepID=UPI003F958B05
MSARVQECRNCRCLLFPERLLCPHCGDANFSTTYAEEGVIEQKTMLADGTILATVLIDRGPRVIARLRGPRMEPGQSVLLTNDRNTVSGAYVPAHSHVLEDSHDYKTC